MRKLAALALLGFSSIACAATSEQIESSCARMGDFASRYAAERDSGVKLDVLQERIDSDQAVPAKDRPAHKMLAQIVYGRPDYTPEVSRKVFIGSCVGGMKAQSGKAG
jgi:hypothetical protein